MARLFRDFSIGLLVLTSAVGLSVVGARADAVDEFIAEQIARKEIPGLALAIVRDGKVQKARGYGVASREKEAPVNAQTVFEIGSITKQFTATLIMMLVEDGKLRLEDRLPKYFSGTPDDWSQITIRHLLTHTSGIRNYTGLDGFEVTRHLDADQFVRALAPHPLDFNPGEKFSYCNSGYSLLGFIIERVAGKSYWDVLQQHILKPLKMNSTFSRDGPRQSNQAFGYEKKEGQLVPRDSNLTDIFAAGAIVSTVADLVRWNAALNSGKLLKPTSWTQIWTPVKLNDGTSYPYGFGWRVDDYKGQKNIGHSGSTSGFSASLQRFPDKKLAVIVLCNLGEQNIATAIARGVANLEFQN